MHFWTSSDDTVRIRETKITCHQCIAATALVFAKYRPIIMFFTSDAPTPIKLRSFERMCELKELKAVALTIAHFIPSFMMSDLVGSYYYRVQAGISSRFC
jgi:hypothetical protein